MSLRHLSETAIEDARNAYACGVPVKTIARHLNVSDAVLRRLLRLPEMGPQEPLMIQRDLFSADDPKRLD